MMPDAVRLLSSDMRICASPSGVAAYFAASSAAFGHASDHMKIFEEP
jgi:hypothetical protein